MKITGFKFDAVIIDEAGFYFFAFVSTYKN
jgi:hypothetical protein